MVRITLTCIRYRRWQREVAVRLAISLQTYRAWEKCRAEPRASSWAGVVRFLCYDPSPPPTSLGQSLKAKRREFGISLRELASRLGWDPETARRYEDDQWVPRDERLVELEIFIEGNAPARNPHLKSAT